MRVTVTFDLDNPSDAALFDALRDSGGAIPLPAAAPVAQTKVAQAPASPPPTPQVVMPGLVAAAPSQGVMPGAAPTPAPTPAPAPASAGGITREALITKMAGAVKLSGPAAVIERLRRDVPGFQDIPSASADLYPAIDVVLDQLAAGK